MSDKVRIHDLAKQYGMPSKELASMLRRSGMRRARSHMSMLKRSELVRAQGILKANGITPVPGAEPPPPDRHRLLRLREPALLGAIVVTLKLDLDRASWLPIAMLWALCVKQVFLQQSDLRSLVFESMVREDSWLQWFRRRNLALWVVAALLAALFAASVTVFVVTSSWLVAITLTVPFLLSRPLLARIHRIATRQFKATGSRVVTYSGTIVGMGTVLTLMMVAAKWMESSVVEERVLSSADSMASYVIANVSHGLSWIQHLARTQAMFDLELLRARTLIEQSVVGDIIYAYYLLPSSLAAIGLSTALCGLLRGSVGPLLDSSTEKTR